MRNRCTVRPPLTILKVKRAGNRVLAILDGLASLRDHGAYRVGPWARLRIRQSGCFPLAEFTFIHKDVEPETLEGWEVERI